MLNRIELIDVMTRESINWAGLWLTTIFGLYMLKRAVWFSGNFK